MGRTVTASEANQSFSRLLGEAEAGETITIERRGRPAARLVPVGGAPVDRARRIAAARDLIDLSGQGKPFVVGEWTRDAVYED